MKAVDEAFAWAKTQNQTLKQALRGGQIMKAEDVKATFWETALIAYHNAEPSQGAEYAMAAALAAVIPMIQKEEREAIENMPVEVPYDSSNPIEWVTGVTDALVAFRDAIRARGEP